MLSFFRVLVLSWFAFTVSAIAVPLLKTRDVIDPPITNPNASTVWTVGSTQLVVWDTSNIPPASQITNPVGKIILGFLDGTGENLMLDSPLAKDFDIRQGSVQVTVPNVPDRSNYIVVLMGDSGNASPKFTITGAGSSSSSPSSSPSTSVAPTPTSSNAPGPGSTPESSTPVSDDGSRPSPGPSPNSSPSLSSDHGSGFAASVSSNYASSTSTSTSGTPTSTSGTLTQPSSPATTLVVISSTSRPTTTTTANSNGAVSNHRPVSVACFSLALIIAGLLL